jgi:hypothetical protein
MKYFSNHHVKSFLSKSPIISLSQIIDSTCDDAVPVVRSMLFLPIEFGFKQNNAFLISDECELFIEWIDVYITLEAKHNQDRFAIFVTHSPGDVITSIDVFSAIEILVMI